MPQRPDVPQRRAARTQPRLEAPLEQPTDAAAEPHLEIELAVARRVLTPAMTGSLATGLLQVALGPFGFGDLWVTGTLAILLALFAIAGSGITLTAGRAVSLAAGREIVDDDPELLPALTYRLTLWWTTSAVLVVAAVTMMVLKPTA